jgi:hypothetical protein
MQDSSVLETTVRLAAAGDEMACVRLVGEQPRLSWSPERYRNCRLVFHDRDPEGVRKVTAVFHAGTDRAFKVTTHCVERRCRVSRCRSHAT